MELLIQKIYVVRVWEVRLFLRPLGVAVAQNIYGC